MAITFNRTAFLFSVEWVEREIKKFVWREFINTKQGNYHLFRLQNIARVIFTAVRSGLIGKLYIALTCCQFNLPYNRYCYGKEVNKSGERSSSVLETGIQ